MILIVEDERISRKALASLLTASGYATAAVESAEEALDFVRHGHVPQVALVDLDLPGMNGLDLIQRLEKANPKLLPVLITAANRERVEDIQRQYDIPCIRKPLDFNELLSLLADNQVRH